MEDKDVGQGRVRLRMLQCEMIATDDLSITRFATDQRFKTLPVNEIVTNRIT